MKIIAKYLINIGTHTTNLVEVIQLSNGVFFIKHQNNNYEQIESERFWDLHDKSMKKWVMK